MRRLLALFGAHERRQHPILFVRRPDGGGCLHERRLDGGVDESSVRESEQRFRALVVGTHVARGAEHDIRDAARERPYGKQRRERLPELSIRKLS